MIPYKCPVCNGRGQVPSGFYNVPVPGVVSTAISTCTETCRSCGGTGIIYGTVPVVPYTPPNREPWVGYKNTDSTAIDCNVTFF